MSVCHVCLSLFCICGTTELTSAPISTIDAGLPDVALSIMQPWAWLIVNGHKDIENRTWSTKFRGSVAIHAGKKIDRGVVDDLEDGIHPVTYDEGTLPEPPVAYDLGGIVGVADIVDCVSSSGSAWFVGDYGFVIANARPVAFIPVKGALGIFRWRDRVLA